MATKSVLVAHHDPKVLERLTAHLVDRGYDVIGPARTASMALALVAQTPVALALVGERLAGGGQGADLAEALRGTWGVRTFVLRELQPA
jgi:ActR/RegA family two-component response regulator